MKEWIIVGVALGIGFVAGRQSTSAPAEKKSVITGNVKAPIAQQPMPCPARPEPQSSTQAPSKDLTQQAQATPATPVEKSVQEDSEADLLKKYPIITSTLIEDLENSEVPLREQIRLTRVEQGWKVTYLSENSLFSEAGFIEGDLITENAIESLRNGAVEERNLPERFSRLLDSVLE